MNFSSNLRRLRVAQELSQEQLAELVGVAREQIAKYENGATVPNIVNGVILAKALKTTVESLVGLDENFLSEKSNN